MRAVLESAERAIRRPGAIFAIPVVFFALLVVGTVRAYTPVPTYDMWEGALLTTFRVLDGDVWEIPRFWNEHRIILAKILFWLEARYFGARFVFLLAVNVALVGALWLAMCAAARRLVPDRDHSRIVCAGIAALSFSWLQRENIDSPFQSEFLLAYLLPLLSFLALARAAREPASRSWFAASLLLGAASLGTMANGLLVFPLLVLMQAALGSSAGRPLRFRLSLLAICGTVLSVLWFQGFPGTQAKMPALVDLMIFVTTFIGFPFAELAGVVGGAIGTILFLAALFVVMRHAWSERRKLDPHVIALLTLIAYVGATSLMTAFGRAAAVANAALIGRYATPSLLAWAALAVLLAAMLQNRPNARRLFVGVSIAGAIALFPAQYFRTTGDRGPDLVHGGQRAALALELDVPDLSAIAWVFHAPTREHYAPLKSVADGLAARGISTFADPRWDSAIAKLGSPTGGGVDACKFNIEVVTEIPGEPRFKAVQGWAVGETGRYRPDFIYMASGGRIVGLAVGGGPRPDVADILGREGRYSGFAGYVLAAESAPFSVLCEP